MFFVNRSNIWSSAKCHMNSIGIQSISSNYWRKGSITINNLKLYSRKIQLISDGVLSLWWRRKNIQFCWCICCNRNLLRYFCTKIVKSNFCIRRSQRTRFIISISAVNIGIATAYGSKEADTGWIEQISLCIGKSGWFCWYLETCNITCFWSNDRK